MENRLEQTLDLKEVFIVFWSWGKKSRHFFLFVVCCCAMKASSTPSCQGNHDFVCRSNGHRLCPENLFAVRKLLPLFPLSETLPFPPPLAHQVLFLFSSENPGARQSRMPCLPGLAYPQRSFDVMLSLLRMRLLRSFRFFPFGFCSAPFFSSFFFFFFSTSPQPST